MDGSAGVDLQQSISSSISIKDRNWQRQTDNNVRIACSSFIAHHSLIVLLGTEWGPPLLGLVGDYLYNSCHNSRTAVLVNWRSSGVRSPVSTIVWKYSHLSVWVEQPRPDIKGFFPTFESVWPVPLYLHAQQVQLVFLQINDSFRSCCSTFLLDNRIW